MKKILTVILSLFFIQGCEAQSQLPKEVPSKLSIDFNENGGMSRSYQKIKIGENLLEIEELKSNRQAPQKRSFTISREDLTKLYQVFAANKFDTIKNDARQGTVYDAGSERISISFAPARFFGVTYGKNSPLSGQNLKRYQAVRKALNDLIDRAQNQQNTESTENELEKFIQGKWRVSGENGGYGWYLEWTFANGSFKQMGYPPLIQEGKYKVLQSSDNKLTLELYDQKGTFGQDPRKLEIIIDRDKNQLSISGTKGFSLVEEKKN